MKASSVIRSAAAGAHCRQNRPLFSEGRLGSVHELGSRHVLVRGAVHVSHGELLSEYHRRSLGRLRSLPVATVSARRGVERSTCAWSAAACGIILVMVPRGRLGPPRGPPPVGCDGSDVSKGHPSRERVRLVALQHHSFGRRGVQRSIQNSWSAWKSVSAGAW